MAEKERYILGIDQGTTSSRALLFESSGRVRKTAQKPLPQIYPRDGWVEQDAGTIWADTLAVCREVCAEIAPSQVAAIGITNQRETSVLWERATGKPLHHALVWQDRRTAQICEQFKAQGRESIVRAKTGLLLDPYFSATKLGWMLDRIEGARVRAKRGELCFGTIDSWLIWNLTEGRVHATDITNASRTLLFDIHTGDWDDEILDWFDIDRALLPEVRACCDDFGKTGSGLLGAAIPITGVAGDQQSAAIGQACFQPGQLKCTYGTGAFALVNTGTRPVESQNRLLTTVACRMNGVTTYALEGSIFMAGAIVQWLRDETGFIRTAAESAALASQANPASRVVLVPAFTGLGAPYWDPDARAAILGMTRDTGVAELVRAGLQSVSSQTRDLVEAIGADMARAGVQSPAVLRVDGGMAANDWFLQNLSDTLNQPVERPAVTETTALGAACLAGIQAGFFEGPEDVARQWRLDRVFDPDPARDGHEAGYRRWKEAVGRILTV